MSKDSWIDGILVKNVQYDNWIDGVLVKHAAYFILDWITFYWVEWETKW